MNEKILYNFLNKRHSTRILSDIEFENLLPVLSCELEQESYLNSYTEDELKKDWNNLCNWKNDNNYINSTNRIGMKLCEHFFPNFYQIENNKGQSFYNLWKKDNLEKILRWNRKSHSTPYLSELKRGIYFCCGLTKNTMYRPQMAKLVCMKYKPKIVLDPCAGWGGRMLGVVSSGSNYIAFEPNTKTYDNLITLAKFLNIENKVRLICDDAMNMLKYDLPQVNCILTSPPYFDVEIYTHEKTQSVTDYNSYENWSEYFLKGIIERSLTLLEKDGVSCWNVGKVGKNDMNDDVLKYHVENNFNKIETLSVVSSKRQALQKTGSEKSSDDTIVYASVMEWYTYKT